MHEIELKFQVPLMHRRAVDAAVAGRAPRPRMRLQAAYVDTPDGALAAAGLALRIRREGRHWVQTLKGATPDGMTRLEHNVPCGGDATVPKINPALHAGSAVGDTLLTLLAVRGTPALSVLYRTDLLRRTRALRVPHGRVELAFDVGRIHAGDRLAVLHELEIELLAGTALAVIDTARRWVPRFGLWLDTRSKAERGDLLAHGETVAAPRLAVPVRLSRKLDAGATWQAVLRSCSDQILVNASQIASGAHTDEHVHQLRIGLRRLRSALKLFKGIGDPSSLDDAVAHLFRRLGGARDAVVLEGEFAADLEAALRSAGVAGDVRLGAPISVDPAPATVLREPGSQVLMLDLLAAAHVPSVPAGAGASANVESSAPGTVRAALAQRLNRWHRQLVADAGRFSELDDAGRHQLRKRAKRLRYAVEFCATLFERRAVRRYLKALRALQDRLGALSDVVMAMQVYGRQHESDPRAMFALGWLAARRVLLIEAALPDLRAFAKTERFWKRR